MPRDYQRKKGKYTLPREVYRQTLWQVRDYHRLKDLYEAVAEERPGPSDGMPRGKGGTSDPTFQKAVKLEHIGRVLAAIDEALALVPPEYRGALALPSRRQIERVSLSVIHLITPNRKDPAAVPGPRGKLRMRETIRFAPT